MRQPDAFRAAGFSTRTANALIYSARINHPDELKTGDWGNGRPDDEGLSRRLTVTPNLGAKGLAEVEAFRAGRDPRTAVAPGPTKFTVPLDDGQLAALDAWIAAQPKPVSRPEAIRAMVAVALKIMGDRK
jgi:hypothetical protein